MTATRREMLAGSGLLLSTAPLLAADHKPMPTIAADDLNRYIDFGIKASGGVGDQACGAWIQSEIENAGFKVERQAFDVPWFEPETTQLTTAGKTTQLVPQAIVATTPSGGLTGKIVRVDTVTGASAPLDGAIALIDLPFARWSSAHVKPVRDTITAAFAAGARGAVLVTNGPTGEAIALNTDGRTAMFPGPVGLLAPKQAAPFLQAAARGDEATLTISGKGGRRPAYNLVGRVDRGKTSWIVVSTPRSGWTTCAGERGPGVAVWLALARWAARSVTTHNLAFLCNSGHEYEYIGAEIALGVITPKPENTAFWLHLGANVAARDWHEPGGGVLLPLSSADPQRFLMVSPTLVPEAKRIFTGLPGLEMVYPANAASAGELSNVLAAGYKSVAGIFGANRYHHVASDDARAIDPSLIAPVIQGCKALIARI